MLGIDGQRCLTAAGAATHEPYHPGGVSRTLRSRDCRLGSLPPIGRNIRNKKVCRLCPAGQRTPQDSRSAHAARSPGAVLIARKLRSHQQQLLGLVTAIGAGETDARDILAAVTPGRGQVAAAGDRRGAAARGRHRRAGLLGGAARQFAAAGRGGVRRPGLARRTRPCARRPRRRQRARPEPWPRRLRLPPTKGSPPPPTCIFENSGAIARCWWSTRCTTSLPSPTSTRPSTPTTTRRAPGPGRCSPCSNAPWCGCCCPARSNAATGGASSGCPTAPARTPARARSRSTRRAGR